MSALAGALGSPFEKLGDAVRRAAGRMLHRVPDGARSVEMSLGGGTGLGLWAGGLASEERVHVAFAGSLYNHAGLGRQLADAAPAGAAAGAAGIALRAYLAWGRDALARMEGAYAVAVFDARQGSLLLARDRLGFRPLYFGIAEQGGGRVLFFASELRALMASGLFARRLDAAGFETFLWNGFVAAPLTMLRGVSSLLPGTCLQVDAGRLQPEQHRYWSVPHQARGSTALPGLRQALSEAVARQLEPDGDAGLFLSGGVDSSGVVALATTVASRKVRTFSVSFDEAAYDESAYAKAVAAALGTEHHEIRLSEAFFARHLNDALGALDQPSFDALNSYMLSRAVRAAGVRVALGGTGGDDLFGGNRTFVDIPKALRAGRTLRWLPDALLDPLTRGLARWKAGRPGSVPSQTRWGKLRDVALAGGRLVPTYQVYYAQFTDRFLRRLLPRAAPEVRFGLPAQRMAELEALVRDDTPLYAIAMLELSIFVADRLLRDIDSVSMSVGLDIRCPLLDERVIAAWSGADEALLFEPLGSKRGFRAAALGRLDASLFERRKAGFVLPFDLWCRQSLKGVLDDTFADREHARSLGLNPDAVSGLWRAFERGEPGLYWSRAWALFVALWWCRSHDVRL